MLCALILIGSFALKIIAVYEPDPNLWLEFRTRLVDS